MNSLPRRPRWRPLACIALLTGLLLLAPHYDLLLRANASSQNGHSEVTLPDEWVKALKVEKAAYPVQYRMLRMWASDDLLSIFPAIKADDDGRFVVWRHGQRRQSILPQRRHASLCRGPAAVRSE